MFYAVIGANYGDEGKGMMTDYFAKNSQGSGITVLVNGGAQRGHTVQDGAFRHVYHSIGSGEHRGFDSYFSKFYIINPIILGEEYLGHTRLWKDRECMWTTPYDMMLNQSDTKCHKTNHSCGMGIWSTICRYQDFKKQEIKIPTLHEFAQMPYAKQRMFLHQVSTYAIKKAEDLGYKNIKENMPYIDDRTEEGDNLAYHFITDAIAADFFAPDRDISDVFGSYDNVIFECAQGLLLDDDYSHDYLYNTPSHCGMRDILDLMKQGNAEGKDVEVCYVARTYLTRHGDGPFQECAKEEIGNIQNDSTNVPNEFQGAIRYGKMEVKPLIRRIRKDFSRCQNGCQQELHNHYTLSVAVTHTNECSFDMQALEEFVNTVYLSDGSDAENCKKTK